MLLQACTEQHVFNIEGGCKLASKVLDEEKPDLTQLLSTTTRTWLREMPTLESCGFLELVETAEEEQAFREARKSWEKDIAALENLFTLANVETLELTDRRLLSLADFVSSTPDCLAQLMPLQQLINTTKYRISNHGLRELDKVVTSMCYRFKLVSRGRLVYVALFFVGMNAKLELVPESRNLTRKARKRHLCIFRDISCGVEGFDPSQDMLYVSVAKHVCGRLACMICSVFMSNLLLNLERAST